MLTGPASLYSSTVGLLGHALPLAAVLSGVVTPLLLDKGWLCVSLY
jgi:hypothetical protein